MQRIVHRIFRRAFLTTCVSAYALICFAVTSTAFADDSRLMRDTKNFMETHGLRGRVVETGPSDRRVKRLVIPVTRHTATDFAERFSEPNGYVRFREGYRDLGTFLFLSLTPGKLFHHRMNEDKSESLLFTPGIRDSRYRRNSELALQHADYYAQAPAVAIPVDVKGAPLAHLKRWLDTAPTSPSVNAEWTNCMHFTCNAEVAPETRMATFLGIKRSIDGPNIIAKFLHAGNNRIEVVARYVEDQAAFDRLSESDLLGPKPYGGISRATLR